MKYAGESPVPGDWDRLLDNVTHSLFGYALARAFEARACARGVEMPAAARRAAAWTAVLASNAPDADIVVGLFAHDAKLAYLLHHRGHTHTLLFAVPLGLLAGAACARVFGVPPGAARRALLLLGALAGALHVAFDALNNYGVHPFFPLDNRWYYGDAVFIVEPLLIAVLLPLPLLYARSRAGRALAALLALLLLVLLWGPTPLPFGVAGAGSAALAAALLAQRRSGPRAGPALLATALLIGLSGAGALRAKTLLAEQLARAAPGEALAQLVTTPYPANPLCWSAIAVTTDARGTYRARLGQLSLAPDLVAPASCELTPPGERTAPLHAAALPSPRGLRWTHRFEAPLARLRELRHAYCEIDAGLRFIRAPFWIDAAEPILGDLRFDRGQDLEFAELRADDDCRDAIPPWVPPLADVLD